MQENSFQCILFEVATEEPDNDTNYEHVCFGMGQDDEFDIVYHIDDDNGVVADRINALDVMHNSGRYKITITNIIVDTDPVITTTTQSEVTVEDLGILNSRKLTAITGDRTMVIFRVSGSDATSSKTAAQISDAFFGTSGDINNLKARYAACSFGKLQIIPGTGDGFTNGVAEITIDTNVIDSENFAIQDAVTEAIIAKYGSSLHTKYDHIVYALPRGTTFGKGGHNRWLAYAIMNSYLSVYNGDNVMFISNLVHETGHNFGLTHSNHGNQKYGDQSGIMGSGYGK